MMDSIFAIAVGLGIRLLVDVVSQHDFRVGGSLVGLWEGVVLYHFLDKMPKSFDPYVAYGFRLFVDFLFTESLFRMALVILWTALGMVLSDIAPVFWYDIGLRHVYRRFRRDMELFGLPTLPFFFSKTNTSSRVRFRSPSRASSSVRSAVTSTSSSTLTLTNVTPHSTPVIPQTTIPHTATRPRKKTRIVPGSFPDDWSETDTDSTHPPSEPSESVSQPPNNNLRPILETDESSVDSDPDLEHNRLTEAPDDDDDLSQTSSDSIDPSATDPLEIPEEGEEPIDDQNDKHDENRTPTANQIPLPPTPAESNAIVHEVHEVQPPLCEVPLIPDSPFVRDTFETAGGEQQTSTLQPDTNNNIPSTTNNDPLPPLGADPPPMSDDIPIDSEPPAYDEPSTDSKAGLTPMDTKTVPNDTSPDGTAGSPPPPTIQVEPPPVSNGVTNGTFPNDNPPPVIGSHSQQDDAQPRLGDDLSPKSDARSVVDSEQPESLLPESPSQRLEEALAFRRKAAKLQKLIVVTEAERKLALEDNKRAVALLKVQERETLEKEEKELNRKAERRFFTAHNKSPMPGKINLGGLESGEAVLRIQAALADLLNRAESSNSNIVELGVDLGKGKVGKISTVKMKIRDAMKEYQIAVHDGPKPNALIITLPTLDE